MPKLPSDEAVRARAEELGLVRPGEDLDHRTRRSVAHDLFEEAKAAELAPKPAAGGQPSVTPLASLDVLLPGIGTMHVDITLTPPKET